MRRQLLNLDVKGIYHSLLCTKYPVALQLASHDQSCGCKSQELAMFLLDSARRKDTFVIPSQHQHYRLL